MTVESWRVAQLVVDRGAARVGSRGSGYLIAPGRVLTAAHVVTGASAVRVRLDVGQATQVDVQAESWWADPRAHEGTDLAVVTIPEAATAGRECEPTRFGRISDCTAVLRVQAFGFPRFKLRADPADADQSGVFRDFEQVAGHTPVAANRRQGTLAVYLDDPPPGEPPSGGPSPWQGISGGAVFTAGRIVAVVAEHYPSEGTGRLTARRIDRAYQELSEFDLDRLTDFLGLAPEAGRLPDVVPVEPYQFVRSAYLAQVQDIAPDLLIGREGELAEWAEFCAGAEPYIWWQAGPWAGKTALASWFVTHPPAGVDIVSFFITGRLSGQADSDAFLDAMIEQLKSLYPGEMRLPAVVGARAGAWLSLLASAAAQTEERARRLVVVVDGLDEDEAGAAPARGRPSIASLLPRHPPSGTLFIVTSRPDPGVPDDLPSGHPLRACTPHSLPVSWVAQDLESRAKQELRDMLASEQIAADAVGYIAGSGGGLTMSDLSALTRAPPHKLDTVLRGMFGRSLHTRASADPRHSQADLAPRVYLFAHETLRVIAEEQLGSELARYRQRVYDWISSYARAGWPDSAPAYAIRGYPRLLAATTDVTALSILARSTSRHEFLLRATGNDYMALTEIGTAQRLIADQNVVDLKALVELAAYRHALSVRNQSIPPEVPIAWARLGRVDHAAALARTLTDPNVQGYAFAGVVTAIAQTGDIDQAEALVGDITIPRAQVGLVTAIAGAGDLDRATALARTITYPAPQAKALADVATAAAQAGDFDRSYRLAAEAEAIARTITDPIFEAPVLAGLASSAAQTGDLDRAEHLASTIIYPERRVEALANVVTAAAQAGDTDRCYRLAAEAEAIARTITDSSYQAGAYARLASSFAQAGDLHVAEAIARTITDPYAHAEAVAGMAEAAAQFADLGRAEALAHTVTNHGLRVRAVAGVAMAAAQLGDLDRAYRLAAEAEALARTITGRDDIQTRALPDVAAAIAQAGELDGAEVFARTIADPGVRARAVANVATVAAQLGDLDRAYRLAAEAEAFARAITNPFANAEALADLATGLAQGGDLDRAEALARTITQPDIQALRLPHIAAAFMQAGDLDRAEALARTITHSDARDQTLADLAATIVQAGDLDRAEALARTLADPYAHARALSDLAAAIVQAGDLDRAEALARTTADPHANAGVLAVVATAAAQAGDLDRAEALARTITHFGVQPRRLADVPPAIAQAGDLGRAEALARTITNPYDHAEAIVSVAASAARFGNLDRVEALVHTITDPRSQARALPAIVREIAQAGALDAAETLARTITAPGFYARAVTDLAKAAAQFADLDRAETLARTITDPCVQARAVADVAKAAAQFGDLDRAYRLAAEAEAVARSITDPMSQGSVLADVAVAIVRAGDLDRAETLARTITHPEGQAWALPNIVRAIAQAGDLDRAEDVARIISQPHLQARTLAELATLAAQADDLSRAGRLLAPALVMGLSDIRWAKPMSQFFPSVIDDTWDVLAKAYIQHQANY